MRSGGQHVARVVEVHHAVLDERRAGKHAVQVPCIGRKEQNRALFPAQKVAAAVMPPVLDAALGIEGAVLIEHVIPFAAAAQAVRVVHPADRRGKVKIRPVRVGGGKRRVLALDARNETGKIALQVVRHGKSLL